MLTRTLFTRATFLGTALTIALLIAIPAHAAEETGDAALYQVVREITLPYDSFYNDVNVVTGGGVVTLSGSVETWKHSQEIEQQIAAIAGVTEVRNYLRISMEDGG